MTTASDFKVGDKVLFGRSHGEQTLGEVVKVNRVKVKVKQLESRGTYRSYSVGTIWTVPVSLLTRANGSAPVVEAPKPRRSEEEIMRDINGLYGALSPENLTCDGELSMTQVRRRAAAIKRNLNECFRELGRRVSEDESWKWYMDRRKATGTW